MEDYQDHIAYNQYSARLSKAEDSSDLLGSGVLLINHKEQRSLLLTCNHVLGSIKDTESFQVVFVSDPDHESISFRKNSNLCKGKDSSSVDQDYILYETPWKEWMNQLADTYATDPMIDVLLTGFGFPQKYNNTFDFNNPLKGGTSLSCSITNPMLNTDSRYFYCRINDEVQAIDLELQGFSGTGLFDKNQCLVGIIKGRDLERINSSYLEIPQLEKEIMAISVSGLTQYLSSWKAGLWENTAMVRCISDPFSNRGICADIMYTGQEFLNLWNILLTMREPSVMFLFGGSNTLKSALEKIGFLSPRWKMCSLEAFEENDSHIGAVYSAFKKEDFDRIRKKLGSRNRAPDKGPVLIHIDVTNDIISHLSNDLDSMELLKCVKKMGGCRETDYVFLSEDCIDDFPCPLEPSFFDRALSQREMINWFWRQDNPDKLPFVEFDDEACRIYDCVKNCKQWIQDGNWTDLSDFLETQDPDALYLSKVISWLNNGKKDAYLLLMKRMSEWETGSVCRWILLLCCRWSVSQIRAMSEDFADFHLLVSLWENPEYTRDTVNAQIAATIRRLIFT